MLLQVSPLDTIPDKVTQDRSYLITVCAMNRDFFLPHKLFYNRKPSLAEACYPGIRNALEDENEENFSDDGDYKILGVKQELVPNKPEEGKEESSCIKEEDTPTGMSRDTDRRSSRSFRRLDVASRVQSRESLYIPTVSSPRPDQPHDPRKSRGLPSRTSTKWPVSLELSGKKIQDQKENLSSQENEAKADERESPMVQITELNDNTERLEKILNGSQKGILSYLPPLSQSLMRQTSTPSKTKKMSFSPTFYADYGLRNAKTDTFPGLYRRKREKSDLEIVKQIEEKANRHIYACQVLSNSKRGSKAAQSVNTLKKTVGPKRVSSSELPTKYVRETLNQSPERQSTFVDVSKRTPFSLFIRTRESPDFTRVRRHKTAPLPEINGHTLILGFDDKH